LTVQKVHVQGGLDVAHCFVLLVCALYTWGMAGMERHLHHKPTPRIQNTLSTLRDIAVAGLPLDVDTYKSTHRNPPTAQDAEGYMAAAEDLILSLVVAHAVKMTRTASCGCARLMH
jgi:hypothetical protein